MNKPSPQAEVRLEIARKTISPSSSYSVTDQLEISFDWQPTVGSGQIITFYCSVIRRGKESAIEFNLALDRLETGELEQLHSILVRRHAGIDNGQEIAQAISWLLDLSLRQSSNLNLIERAAAVRQMLLA